MNLAELRRQQAALLAHEASKRDFQTLLESFGKSEDAIRAGIVHEFAQRGLEARFFALDHGVNVSVPPSPRAVFVYPWTSLTFNHKFLRSEHSGGADVGEEKVLSVTPLEPLALPVSIVASDAPGFGGRPKSHLWWRGVADNQRLVAMVVSTFEGAKGPEFANAQAPCLELLLRQLEFLLAVVGFLSLLLERRAYERGEPEQVEK